MTDMNTGAASLSDEQKRQIAAVVHRDCTLLPGANFYTAAELAIQAALAQISRTTPTPQADAAPTVAEQFVPDAALNFAAYLIDHCEGETITEESLQVWLGKMVKLPRYNPSAEGALASMTRMFHAACADLGAINEALGLDPDDGGAEPILEAIVELRAAIAAGGAQEVAQSWIDGVAAELWAISDVSGFDDFKLAVGGFLIATALPRVAATVMPDDTSAFKNFHRQLCERFGYVHDEKDWRRDQVSLIECIAKKLETVEKDSARYRRFRRWHPRLQTSYWTGKWWEPIYGEKMDVCVDWLDEVPQPTPHADQCDSAAPAASNGEQA